MPINTVKIKQARERAGLSATAAAERAGMSKQQWYKIESGRQHDARSETLSRVAQAVGLGLADVVK